MEMAISRARAMLASNMTSARAALMVLAGFGAALFLSAFLLFSVQPIFTKMVLPQLGGSPSVWAVSTCFFQAVLFAGYGYAHVLNRYCPPRLAPFAHLGVLTLAFAALPVGLPAQLAAPPADGAYLWLVGVLAAGVGLPFFAISASAPLLQAWFSRTGNPHARDPYFLYGASNLGSLLALLGYPVLIEPWIGLQSQSRFWSIGFLMLAAAIAAAGLVMVSAMRAGGVAANDNDAGARADAEPTKADKLKWALFSAVPSGLLVAFTTHVSTDIAAAPFLWVIPLALFLLTFVLVFRDRSLVPGALLLRLQPLLAAFAIFTLSMPALDVWETSTATFAAFLVTTLVAHRALYEQRPAARYLTAFYMWMSLGGILGGIFAAVVSPQLFNATYEFPLLLTLSMLCRPGIFTAVEAADRRWIRGIAVASMAVLVAGVVALRMGSSDAAWTIGGAAVVAGLVALIFAKTSAKAEIALIAAMSMLVVLLPSNLNRGNPTRSFFGVLRVVDAEEGAVRLFFHGTTSHGAQRLTDKSGNPINPPVPATYYHPGSAMARALDVARSVRPASAMPFSAGVIGLGVGSMACYARPDETWRFYEIDAAVVDLAKDASKFQFLSACQPDADIVLGDGRLTIAREPSESFDYLQVDAFSSDSVPTHLLTVEAVKLFLDKLAPEGVLAMHVSNRHLDLAPVAVAAALSTPGVHTTIVHTPAGKVSKLDAAASAVVLVTKSAAAMKPIAAWPEAIVKDRPSIAPWTDDYSDIISALWRVYGVKLGGR